MDKGTLKNFFLAKTTHRIPKILTLAVSSSLLVALVNIDASASAVGHDSSRSAHLIQVTDRLKHWSTASSVTHFVPSNLRAPVVSSGAGTTTPTTTTTTPPTAPVVFPTGFPTAISTSTATEPPPTTTTTPPSTTTTSPPAATTTTTTPPPTTTTTTPVATASASGSGGLITAGQSRSECLEPNFDDTGLSALQSAVTSFDNLTNTSVTCVLAYTNGAQTWAQWDDPWVTANQYGYAPWVAEAPQTRQLVLDVDLIPGSLSDTNDPSGWEQSCANGDYNTYAATLGTNLVAAGLQNSVIRLGTEMNGPWEADYIGTTTNEQNLWATCFANEVTAMRQATGEHFLFDWNPNACSMNVPYANFYPGNAYVDIVGLDIYDLACDTPTTSVSFTQLANEPAGITSFEAFANAQGKPMSFPEWGLESSPSGDDPAYIDGIGSAVANGNFAFEAYFDAGANGTVPLGSSTPLSLAQFQKWF
jgi:beta-mannanase